MVIIYLCIKSEFLSRIKQSCPGGAKYQLAPGEARGFHMHEESRHPYISFEALTHMARNTQKRIRGTIQRGYTQCCKIKFPLHYAVK
jgi:hypothetical protein